MRGTREGRRREVEQFLAMEWGQGNGSGVFKIPLLALRRMLRSLRCPLRLCAPGQSVCNAETIPERRENPVSSLSWFTDRVNRPRPKNERKSAVQLLTPLAAPASSAADSPVSAVPSPFMRSPPIRLHRRDDTGTQRKPCFVALLISRSGESSGTEK